MLTLKCPQILSKSTCFSRFPWGNAPKPLTLACDHALHNNT